MGLSLRVLALCAFVALAASFTSVGAQGTPFVVPSCSCGDYFQGSSGEWIEKHFDEFGKGGAKRQNDRVKSNRYRFHNFSTCHLQACEVCKSVDTYVSVNPKLWGVGGTREAEFDSPATKPKAIAKLQDKICGPMPDFSKATDMFGMPRFNPKDEKFGLGDHEFRGGPHQRGKAADSKQPGDWTYRATQQYSEVCRDDMCLPPAPGSDEESMRKTAAVKRCHDVVADLCEEGPLQPGVPGYGAGAPNMRFLLQLAATREDVCAQMRCCYPAEQFKEWSRFSLPSSYKQRAFKQLWTQSRYSWFRNADVTIEGLPLTGSGRIMWTNDPAGPDNPSPRRFLLSSSGTWLDEHYGDPLGARPSGGYLSVYLSRIPKYEIRQGTLNLRSGEHWECDGCKDNTSQLLGPTRQGPKLGAGRRDNISWALRDRAEHAAMICQLGVFSQVHVYNQVIREKKFPPLGSGQVAGFWIIDDLKSDAEKKKFSEDIVATVQERLWTMIDYYRCLAKEKCETSGGTKCPDKALLLNSEQLSLQNVFENSALELSAYRYFFLESDNLEHGQEVSKDVLEPDYKGILTEEKFWDTENHIIKNLCRKLEACGDESYCGWDYDAWAMMSGALISKYKDYVTKNCKA